MQPLFVGDVQGCADELEDALDRAERAFGGGFVLFSVGDLVNRGPNSLRVLRRVRALADEGRARVVLGNHEIHLLRCALGLAEPGGSDSFHDVLEAPDLDDWIEWLRTRPLVEAGTIGQRPFAVVHAAVHPDWGLDELVRRARKVEALLAGPREDCGALLRRDPRVRRERDVLGRLLECRSVDEEGGWSAREPARPRDAWHRHWSRRAHPYGVVFGHWSLQGLLVAPGLRGLDTGCVHHGRGRDGFLTVWVPDPEADDPFAVPDERFWAIPAHRRYHPFAR